MRAVSMESPLADVVPLNTSEDTQRRETLSMQ